MPTTASDNGAPEKTNADKVGAGQILSKSPKRSAERVALSVPLREAIYTRYSTRFQHSTTDQIRACRKWADGNGVEVADTHVLSDEAASGRMGRRSGLARLMELIEDDEIDVVISFATDRLHRKVHAALNFVQTYIVEKSKWCVFVSQNVDSEKTEFWEMLLRVFAIVDEVQVKQAGGLIREAHLGLLHEGLVHGTLPFRFVGSRVEGERVTRQNKPRRRITVDSEGSAPWVRRVFPWYVHERMDFHDIARRLRSEGAPPPPKVDQWTWAAVKHAIRNRRYVGDWSYGIFRTVWQSKADYGRQIRQDSSYHVHRIESLRIIDDDLFTEAQLIADTKRHRGGRKRRSRSGQTVRDPLQGLLFCPGH